MHANLHPCSLPTPILVKTVLYFQSYVLTHRVQKRAHLNEGYFIEVFQYQSYVTDTRLKILQILLQQGSQFVICVQSPKAT